MLGLGRLFAYGLLLLPLACGPRLDDPEQIRLLDLTGGPVTGAYVVVTYQVQEGYFEASHRTVATSLVRSDVDGMIPIPRLPLLSKLALDPIERIGIYVYSQTLHAWAYSGWNRSVADYEPSRWLPPSPLTLPDNIDRPTGWAQAIDSVGLAFDDIEKTSSDGYLYGVGAASAKTLRELVRSEKLAFLARLGETQIPYARPPTPWKEYFAGMLGKLELPVSEQTSPPAAPRPVLEKTPMVVISARRHGDTAVPAFALSPYEVTQEQLDALLPDRLWTERCFLLGEPRQGPDLPATCLSFFEALAFCNRLSELEGLTPVYGFEGPYQAGSRAYWDRSANGYRLPTAAEWEHAARAGSSTAYVGTSDPAQACRFGNVNDLKGWTDGAGQPRPPEFPCEDGYESVAPVRRAGVEPNGFGLFEMGGNVAELVWEPFEKAAQSDGGIIAVDGKDVATRGASFFSRREDSGIERVEARAWAVEAHATVGFRVARSLEGAR